ncbi:DEAD/DEAH box helicase [Bacteroides timonensis]|uniref:DEAD/DEAH box helicase n=1 Tax=Bacteroides timonensis TaxID=1470345 RepID=UPI0005C63D9E|nr:DEAD/DEAH box helicase [Bacteroides timonensis]
MVKKSKTSKKTKDAASKVSYHYKPDNLTLEEWQIALRRQAVAKEQFAISEMNRKEYPGYYQVVNPVSHNEYRVVYRGQESPWNYCSCMDFKTNQLGTCKHLEAVGIWLKESRKRVCRDVPPYTSVYLSYKGERKVCLRIGTDNAEEFRRLAEPYFTPEGVLRPEALDTVTDFLRDALRLNDTFRWYSDALSFILEKRDAKRRQQLLSEVASDAVLDVLLKAKLYPYQKEGIRFAFRAGKSVIADEMGLGKTIQAIGTAELMRKQNLISSVLIVCPTSLKYQWKKEIERFTDAKAVVVEGNHLARKKLYDAGEFYKIVSYNGVCNDIKILKSLYTDFLIMDEVQRLKNWNTQISKAARHIESEYAVILSGTPLENKLEELYSIMQFVDQYCLGPYYQFMDSTVVKSETGKIISYKNLNAIGEQMKDVLIRRRKKDVALQLPGRMDKILFVPMTEQQRAMHDEYQTVVSQIVYKWTRARFLSEKDRKRLLLMLSQMRMICDSSYILDQKSRYDTKVEETMNILKTVFDSGDEKVVIFSQWERMTRLVAAELDTLGVRYEYLHGGVPSEARKNLVDNFTEQPESRVFLSTDAGSTGLNLQAASILINLDLPWNPAVLEQRIARIYRIGQKKNIQVINLVASQTIEERMLSTLNFKSSLFEGILDNGEDVIFLEDSKLDKIMDSIKVMTEPIEMGESAQAGSDIRQDDGEEARKTDAAEKEIVPEQEEKPVREEIPVREKDTLEAERDTSVEPEQLVQQGFSFLSGLARTLSSPEATRKLVDSIVEEDKETGQTSLRIPVPDKKSVAGILNLFGKLLAGG